MELISIEIYFESDQKSAFSGDVFGSNNSITVLSQHTIINLEFVRQIEVIIINLIMSGNNVNVYNETRTLVSFFLSTIRVYSRLIVFDPQSNVFRSSQCFHFVD